MQVAKTSLAWNFSKNRLRVIRLELFLLGIISGWVYHGVKLPNLKGSAEGRDAFVGLTKAPVLQEFLESAITSWAGAYVLFASRLRFIS